MKWLGNFTKQEAINARKQYDKLVKRDNMEAKELQTPLPISVVQGNINNPQEWDLLKRTGHDDLYPLSKAFFRNVHTGEIIQGMFNESSGSKLLGEIIQ